jgi:hypothetical protein
VKFFGLRGSMHGGGAQRGALVLGVTLTLAACGHDRHSVADSGSEEGINAYPTNYKSDILAAMHSYLNDPTGIHSAAIAQPALKTTANMTTNGAGERYVVCLQFNPKKNASEYAGVKTVAAVFLAGRFDHFTDVLKDECTGATYTPFPELQKLLP